MNRVMTSVFVLGMGFFATSAQVIVLNGTSSVGKTSIAKELQELFDEPYLHTGLDFFLPTLPHKLSVYGAQAEHGIHFLYSDDALGKTVIIEPGSVGRRFLHAMHCALAAMEHHGMNLIIEDVILSRVDLGEYLSMFKDIQVYFIGVFADQAIADVRECARGDRAIGISRGLARVVHKNKMYDYVVDTSHISAQEAAKNIKQYVQNHAPHAGDMMRALQAGSESSEQCSR